MAIVEDARMVQGLDNRQVRIGQLRVLAHDGDLHLVGVMVGVILFAQELVPLAHVALTRVQTQALANAQVKSPARQAAAEHRKCSRSPRW